MATKRNMNVMNDEPMSLNERAGSVPVTIDQFDTEKIIVLRRFIEN